MKNRERSHISNGSSATRGADCALTRRELMGASLVGTGLLGASATALMADSAQSKTTAAARRRGDGSLIATFTFGNSRATHHP